MKHEKIISILAVLSAILISVTIVLGALFVSHTDEIASTETITRETMPLAIEMDSDTSLSYTYIPAGVTFTFNLQLEFLPENEYFFSFEYFDFDSGLYVTRYGLRFFYISSGTPVMQFNRGDNSYGVAYNFLTNSWFSAYGRTVTLLDDYSGELVSWLIENSDLSLYFSGFDNGYTNGWHDGADYGRMEGWRNGYSDGYTSGTSDGYSDGYDEGYLDGYLDGISSRTSYRIEVYPPEIDKIGVIDSYFVDIAKGDPFTIPKYSIDGYSISVRVYSYDYPNLPVLLNYSMGDSFIVSSNYFIYYDSELINNSLLGGYSDGYTGGYNDGYDLGHNDGYNSGYNNGLNKGQSDSLINPVTFFLSPVSDFLNYQIFGTFNIASILNVILFVSLALVFIKMFAGG